MAYSKISNKKVRETIYNKYGGKCAYCGCSLENKFTIDHIIPKRRYPTELENGKDDINNYNPCCYSCNASKSSYELEDWRKALIRKYDWLLKHQSSFNIIVRFGIVKKQTESVVFYFERF